MKKFTKTLTASLIAAAASANIFAVPASHVAYAAGSTEIVKGDVISVKSIPSAGRVGYPVIIPKMSFGALGATGSVSNVAPVVTRPDGRSVTVQEVTSGEAGWTFTPSVSGTYKLVYKGTANGVETVSEVFSIKVTKESYEMAIDENSAVVIPSTVDTNKDRFTGGVIKDIKLPHPTVTDKNDFVIFKDGKLNEAITKYGALKGGWLAFKRLLRCNPFYKGSPYDPVP